MERECVSVCVLVECRDWPVGGMRGNDALSHQQT